MQHIHDELTYCCNRNQNFNKETSQSMLNVLVLDFQEILGTLLQKTEDRMDQDSIKRCNALNVIEL